MSADELSELFVRDEAVAEQPRGVWRGHVLVRIDHATARLPHWRLMETLMFDETPFGIDFDRRRWFFFVPRLAAGHFSPRIGPSRWRDTEAVQLHYEVSRLPGFVKGLLYDEVKPLGDDLMLGIGGINAGRGVGDHFYFALQRR